MTATRHGFDLHGKGHISTIQECYVARLLLPAGKDSAKHGGKGGAVCRGNELPEPHAEQPGAHDPEEGSAGEVHGTDGPIAVDSNVADRGEIVEVGILFQSRFQIVPGSAQLFILHLQFDLVDLQFVKESLRFSIRPGRVRFRRFRFQPLFCTAAQFGGFRALTRCFFHVLFPVYANSGEQVSGVEAEG